MINRNHDFTVGSGFNQGCNPERNAIFSFFHPAGKAAESKIQHCQGVAVKCHGFASSYLVMTPSGSCSVRVKEALIFGPRLRHEASWIPNAHDTDRE
jgi:hypothetical protein